MRKYLLTAAGIFAVATIGSWWYFYHMNRPAATIMSQRPHTHVTTSFNKNQYSLTDPASIWVISNKQHPLQPLDYAPTDLRSPHVPLRPGGRPEELRSSAAAALEAMDAAATRAGLHLVVVSGYRSYQYQVSVYGGYVHNVGQDAADQESARPGYSEHQTGLAVDLAGQDGRCTLEACFGDTAEGKWLDTNAYRFGFLLRYPADKVTITGYEYEPWHFRYIGSVLSDQMHIQNIHTLEEFFDVTGGTTY